MSTDKISQLIFRYTCNTHLCSVVIWAVDRDWTDDLALRLYLSFMYPRGLDCIFLQHLLIGDPCQSFGLHCCATVLSFKRILTVIRDSHRCCHLCGQDQRSTMGVLYQLSYNGILKLYQNLWSVCTSWYEVPVTDLSMLAYPCRISIFLIIRVGLLLTINQVYSF